MIIKAADADRTMDLDIKELLSNCRWICWQAKRFSPDLRHSEKNNNVCTEHSKR